ncbi:hypothetical protein ACOMHN_007545 [Nucella lapillus]
MVNSAGVTSLSYPMFPCEDGITTVQHSMVCDFRQDCPDNSDESFCEHPSRTGFLCSNGQYALRGQRCNEHSDCADDSDEKNCDDDYGGLCQFCSEFTYEAVNQLWYINLDGSGSFTWQLMQTACTVSWCVGSLLSLVPFLPGLSSWGLQGQAGLCRLAALDNLQFSHGFKWFTVIVILNFMLCLMTVAAAGRCGSVFPLVRGLSKLRSL